MAQPALANIPVHCFPYGVPCRDFGQSIRPVACAPICAASCIWAGSEQEQKRVRLFRKS